VRVAQRRQAERNRREAGKRRGASIVVERIGFPASSQCRALPQ
jgi:hypothetical protein